MVSVFHFIKEESVVIPKDIREKLKEHYITEEELEKNNKNEIKENINKVEELDYFNLDK